MKRQLVASIAVLTGILSCAFVSHLATAQPSASGPAAGSPAGVDVLKVVKTFIAGESNARWDALRVDPDAGRVYVSSMTKVLVFDAEKGTVAGEVADVQGAHDIAIVSDRSEGFATSGKDNVVVVFDLKTLKTLRRIPTGKKPDAIVYDPFSKRVFVFNGGSGDATVIDPAAGEKPPGTLTIGGKLEFAVADGEGEAGFNFHGGIVANRGREKRREENSKLKMKN